MDGHQTGSPQGPGKQNPAYGPAHRHHAPDLRFYPSPDSTRHTGETTGLYDLHTLAVADQEQGVVVAQLVEVRTLRQAPKRRPRDATAPRTGFA